MLKKLLAALFTIALLLQSFPTAAASLPPKTINSDFVDVSCKIAVKEFYIHTIRKSFAAAPYYEGKSVFVQVDCILPMLGYKAVYDSKAKVLTAEGPNKLVIKAGSTSYTFNGKINRFTFAPKVKSMKLMVPLEELFKAMGCTVKVDRLAGTVRITKYKSFDTGSIVFYDKTTSLSPQSLFRMDGKELYRDVFTDISIYEFYSYKGVIIGNVYDRLLRFNKLVRYDKGKFINLKANFDVISTYEFGGSRVFYGYDNEDKKYKLYRFDGSSLVLVVDDCYSSVQVNFKDSIILNKYDSNRDYTVVKLDSRWNMTVLDTKKTMTQYFISDNWLYMKAVPQEGTGIYFMVFNGDKVVNVAIPAGSTIPVESIKFECIRICDNKIYTIVPVTYMLNGIKTTQNKLVQLQESQMIRLPDDQLNSDFSILDSYNGRLYLCGYRKLGGIKQYSTFEYTPGGTYSIINDPKLINKNIMFTKSYVELGTLFLTGKLLNDKGAATEDVLYVYRGGVWNYAMDIVSLESFVQTSNGLYLNVKDYGRSTPSTKRDSVLFIDNSLQISNAAIDFNITNQSVLGSSLVFAGANNITKRSEVNRHNIRYDELIPGYTVSYWEQIQDRVFTGGRQDAVQSLNCITASDISRLKDNFDAKDVYAARKAGLYLVYGIEHDKTSPYNGCRVLYLYDIQTAVFTLVTAGVDIKQIL